MLGATLAVALPLAVRFARALDALVLGEASASSLGLNLPVLRLALVALMALCTGSAVAQAGLVAFVGLVARPPVPPTRSRASRWSGARPCSC